MNQQEQQPRELSQEELQQVNGGSGLLDGLPILGDLLGSNDNNRSNNDHEGSGNSGNRRNSGGLLGGLLG